MHSEVQASEVSKMTSQRRSHQRILGVRVGGRVVSCLEPGLVIHDASMPAFHKHSSHTKSGPDVCARPWGGTLHCQFTWSKRWGSSWTQTWQVGQREGQVRGGEAGFFCPRKRTDMGLWGESSGRKSHDQLLNVRQGSMQGLTMKGLVPSQC